MTSTNSLKPAPSSSPLAGVDRGRGDPGAAPCYGRRRPGDGPRERRLPDGRWRHAPGDKVGGFTLVSRERGAQFWWGRCRCGRIAKVRPANAAAQCLKCHNEAQRVWRAGMKAGNWTVVRRGPHGRVMGRCACGETAWITPANPPEKCRRCFEAEVTRWYPGARVGRWTLKRREGASPAGWLAVCECGRRAIINPRSVESGAAGGACIRCAGKARRKPKVCGSCGTKNPRRFTPNLAIRCSRCDRRHHRNGSCSCGAAFVGGFTSRRRCPRGCAKAVSA